MGKRKTYEGSWIQTLNKAGYSCAGIDNRGSGRSNGLFGYVNDHKDWVNDMVSSSHPSRPSNPTAADGQQRAWGCACAVLRVPLRLAQGTAQLAARALARWYCSCTSRLVCCD